MTYGNGAVASYAYDNLDRVTHEYWNDTLKYQYFYNAEGNLSKKLDVVTNKAVNYEYDSLGRLIHSYQTNGNSIVQKTEHIYDTENRIKSQSWQLGDTVYSESYIYDEDDGSLSTMKLYQDGSETPWDTVTFAYDVLKRLSVQSNSVLSKAYTYRDITSGSQTTTQVSKITYSKVDSNSLSTFYMSYTYDAVGNITALTTNFYRGSTSYAYDQQGQLTDETNYYGTYQYSYDTYGNIRSVEAVLRDETTETHTYTYGDSEWLDLLTAYDGHTINYDAIGNPTNWYNTKDWTFIWQNGRQLATATDGTTSISYTYDVAGIRDSKTVGTTTYNYLTQNGQVVRQTWTENGTDHVMDFIYDNNGRPYAFIYDGTTYYYILNLQGDVIRIVGTTGATVCTYSYDAWGRLLNTSTNEIFNVNPIRYRGYYYDSETGLYYLQSRYYDPTVKRFVNADGYASTGQGFVGYNMFAYCNNCPSSFVDLSGNAMNTALCVADTGGNKGGNLSLKIIAKAVGMRTRFCNTPLVQDIKNFNWNNTSEQAVIDSNYFSAYKGKLAFRTNGNRCGSFGALFITRGTNQIKHPEDMVRHEYGHTVQMKNLGVVKYTLCILIPSWQEWGSETYYEKPWEVTADFFGGVESRPMYNLNAGSEYLRDSRNYGILVWATID